MKQFDVLGLKISVRDGGGVITEQNGDWERDNPNPDDADYDAARDALECLILAHACAGVDVESKSYKEGVETALETLANRLW